MTDRATIILAAGKGTRMKKTDGNKVVTLFHGKPLISIAVETALSYSSRVIVVVGAHAESVQNVLTKYSVEYVHQIDQNGTAHATQMGLKPLHLCPPRTVVVGYGDHMMFYTPEVVQRFIHHHIKTEATVSLVTAHFSDIDTNSYGRIIRSPSGTVARIVEQKDATDEEKKITEINAGLYCFDYSFLEDKISTITPSAASGEYYLTDMIAIANGEQKKVVPFVVSFNEIGYGINSKEDLEKSLKMKPANA